MGLKQRLIGLGTAGVLLFGGGVALAPSASAAGCAEGVRSESARLASANPYGLREVKSAAWTSSIKGEWGVNYTSTFQMTLRFDPVSRCAWGLMSGTVAKYRAQGTFWTDRTTYGESFIDSRGVRQARSWTGLLDVTKLDNGIGNGIKQQSTSYNAPRYDGGYLMRACGNTGGTTYCTAWY
jgi:hypothetical protein